MSRNDDVTQLINRLSEGDENAGPALVTELYKELQQVAVRMLRFENPQNSLQATALVHEAFLRLFPDSTENRGRNNPTAETRDSTRNGQWENRAHFFGAAAEAMRRILVDAARRRNAVKRGGEMIQSEIEIDRIYSPTSDEDVLAVHEVLDELAETDAQAADLIKLRFFAGMTMSEVAEVLGVSTRTAGNIWAYARAWIRKRLDHHR